MKKVLKLSSLVIVLGALLSLTACAPKDAPSAKEKLEAKEYTVAADGTLIPAALKLLGVDGIETVLTATKKTDNGVESVTAILFDESSKAKEYMEEVKKCYGCGAIIQSHNEKHIGYVPKNATQREHILCQRCFQLKNYHHNKFYK